MSLRTKFVLALGTIVSVLVAVTTFSVVTTWRTQGRVAGLTDVTIVELERGRFVGEAFEIEGHWSDDGMFEASEIEALPHPRRPKIRSAIQRIDAGESRIWMLGMPIQIDDETQVERGGRIELTSLHPGQRLEISCEVLEDGTWRGRKVRIEDLKESDKVKGIITASQMDGVLPDTLEISGLRVLMTERRGPRDPRAHLRRLSLAMQLSLTSLDCGLAGQHVARDPAENLLTRDGDYLRADEFLLESIHDFGATVELIKREPAQSAPEELEASLWLERIDALLQELARHGTTLLRLASDEAASAESYYEEEFDPFVLEALQPTLNSYLQHVEESLVDEVNEISAQSAQTSRLLLVTSGFAILLSMLMAMSLWKSVSKPLRLLRDAADKIGEGDFTTRVEATSNDEFSILAGAMNEMAAQLDATTVSLSNLDDIFGSMASALFVVDLNGNILSANSAALELLGYESSSELEGQSFDRLLIPMDGDVHEAGADVVSRERRLRRADGGETAVVLSEASLRGGANREGGYVYAAQDLTERLAMEERLRHSIAEKDLLLREVHHRVKNNLQVISSLLALQASQLSDEDSRTVFAECQSRIRSMAMIHEQLYGSADVAEIDLSVYLRHLAHALHQSQTTSRNSIEIELRLQPATINLDQALACGLILNELVTNSLKHAFEAGTRGVITVESGPVADNRVVLSVGDNGRGLDSSAQESAQKGLGTRLVRALTDQLGGTLSIEQSRGLLYHIEFPTESVVVK